MKRYLVTSALPYANGKVHLGHLAGAYLPADIYVRWLRLKGADVRFICGSDEHGVPITLSALKRGVSPQQVVDEYHVLNGAAFAAADVVFDIWGRTSSVEHHHLTQQIFRRLHAKGYIDKRTTQQLYSEKSKMFLPDRYVEGTCPICGYENARGDQCDKCGGTYEVTELKNPRVAIEGDGSTPVLKSTAHWFLRLDLLEDKLKKFVEAHSGTGPDAWRLNAQREATGWLKRGLQPRCITRDTLWGVKIPLDDPEAENKRIYVWFDAPIGYTTFTQQFFARLGEPEKWKEYWQSPDCSIIHFIGKDNIPFHAITFPAVLMGANEQVPPAERPYELVSQVVANEFLNFGADKFSKSRGNIIEIGWFAERYGSEALRYYLTAVAPESNDSTFTWEDFLQRYNGELADILGNFVHRVLKFTETKFGGKIPDPGLLGSHQNFADETATALSNTAALLDGFQFRNALAAVINCARAGNVYFDANAPWKSIKTDAAECNKLMYVCIARVAALGLMLRPFLPRSASAILGNFGVADPLAAGTAKLKPEDVARAGLTLNKPEVLFKKLEAKELPNNQ
ncbi:MAG TPA: methionine--tRNA ligase [Planctomycetota bacterium]